jgi:hypothetical protein
VQPWPSPSFLLYSLHQAPWATGNSYLLSAILPIFSIICINARFIYLATPHSMPLPGLNLLVLSSISNLKCLGQFKDFNCLPTTLHPHNPSKPFILTSSCLTFFLEDSSINLYQYLLRICYRKQIKNSSSHLTTSSCPKPGPQSSSCHALLSGPRKLSSQH